MKKWISTAFTSNFLGWEQQLTMCAQPTPKILIEDTGALRALWFTSHRNALGSELGATGTGVGGRALGGCEHRTAQLDNDDEAAED